MAIIFNFIDPSTMILQGATWSHQITIQESDGSIFDLTGYTARMQIRETHNSAAILLELTTENGRIAINTSTGTITLTILASDTTEITWSRGVYDLELVYGITITRLFQGSIEVSPNVTR